MNRINRVKRIFILIVCLAFFNQAGAMTDLKGNVQFLYEVAEQFQSNDGQGFQRVVLPPATFDAGAPGISALATPSVISPSSLNQSQLQVGVVTPGPTEEPARIKELARALRYDPDLIFEFVHDNINYYPIWGVQKGVLGALLDGEGTAFDQALLFVELLRESGIQATYVVGEIEIDAEFVQTKFGFPTAKACPIFKYLSQAQIPITQFNATSSSSCPGSGADLVSLRMMHIWVKALVNDETRYYDPSLKPLNVVSGTDLIAATGFNQSSYMSDAQVGATVNSDFVQNLNTNNINNNLLNYTNNLISHIRNNQPDANLKDIIGGTSIVPLTDLPGSFTTLPPPYVVPGSATTEYTGDLPNSYRPTLQVIYQGIDQTFTSDAIYGKRLTLFFNASNQPELRLDGALIASGNVTAPDTNTTINFNVVHSAYASNEVNQSFAQSIRSGGSYVISNGWGPVNRPMVDFHQDLLNDNLSTGASNTSESVLGESLSAISYGWLAEITASSKISDQIGGTFTLYHHQVGITGQNDGPYVDLPGNVLAIISKTDDQAAENAVFWDSVMHNSIFESVAVEQFGGVSAVSTVKLIDIANSQSLRIYDATSSNYNASVEPNLTACENFTASFQAAVSNGNRLILPERCDIGENSWTGTGYLNIRSVNGLLSIGGLISGGLFGGLSSIFQSPENVNLTVNDPETFSNPYTEGKAESGWTFGDPVDVFKGNYLLSNDDIRIGNGKHPYSLTFIKSYSSSNRRTAGIIGNGWSHNYNVTVAEGVDGFQGMGEDSPIDASSSIAEKLVSIELMKDPAKPINKIITAVIGQRWFADQLLNNMVIVKNGSNAEMFVKLANGQYNPPPGRAVKLVKNSDDSFTYETLDKIQIDFNPEGKAISWVNPNGMTVSFSYSNNKLDKVTNSLGRELTFAYNGDFLSQVSDGKGREVQYTPDTNGDLVEFTDTLGKKTTFEYDLPGRMTKVFYPTRPTIPYITNVYDTLGRIQSQSNAYETNTWQYYFAGSRSEEVDPDGGTKIRYQDRFGNPLRLIDEVRREVVNRYDGQNRIVLSTQPEGNSIAYAYDDATCGSSMQMCSHNVGLITESPKPGSPLSPLTQSFTYHSTFGKILSSTDARNATTDYGYDAQTGQLLSVLLPPVILAPDQSNISLQLSGPLFITLPPDLDVVRPERTFAYDTFSSTTLGGDFTLLKSRTDKITRTESTTTTYTYDESNFFVPKIVTVDAGGLNLVTTSIYDNIGNLSEHNGPRTDVNDITSYGYDSERRLVSTTDALGNKTLNHYDEDGDLIRLASKSDNQWQVACTGYTPTKKFEKVWGPSLTTSPDQCPAEASPIVVKTFQYDTVDRVSVETNLISVSQGGPRATKTDYFADGKTQRIIRDFGGPLEQNSSTFTYSANGMAETVSDAAGNLTTYEYDGFDRMLSTRFPDTSLNGQSSSTDRDDFSYDENGNTKTWKRRTGETIQYVYDNLNRLTNKQLPAQNVFYDYDLLSRLTFQTISDSARDIAFEYDHASRVKSVTQGSKTVSYQHDAVGNRTLMTWPDGFFVEYDYDATNRLERIDEMTSTLLATYQYNDLWQRNLATLGNGTTTTSGYSNESRLDTLTHTFAGNDIVTITHEYNQVGQLLSRTTSNDLYDGTPSATINQDYETNGLNQYTFIEGIPQQHDSNANLADDGQWALGFDVENRLISAIDPNSTVLFEYDDAGRRFEKSHNGTVRQYFYDGVDLIAVYDDADNLIQRYVHGPGVDEPLVWYDYDTQGTLQTKRWFYADHQGSIIATANTSGSTDQVYAYSPFGTPAQTGPSLFRYTGQVWDEETQLAYYKARYYSPTRGRFLSTDPVGYIDSFNLYAYVINDPVNLIDPSGLVYTAARNQADQYVDLLAETGNDVINQTSGHPSGKFLGLYGVNDYVSILNEVQNGDYTGVAVGAGIAIVGSASGGIGRVVTRGPDFFRGARPGSTPDFTPRANDFKVNNATGTVKPTHGVSVFDNAADVSKNGFVPHKIDQSTVPDSLQIIQRGSNPGHFEITPKPGANLTPQQFSNACSQIGCK